MLMNEWMSEWMPAHESAQYSPNPTLEPGAPVGYFICLAMSDPLVTNWRTGHDTTGRDTTGHNITR